MAISNSTDPRATPWEELVSAADIASMAEAAMRDQRTLATCIELCLANQEKNNVPVLASIAIRLAEEMECIFKEQRERHDAACISGRSGDQEPKLTAV